MVGAASRQNLGGGEVIHIHKWTQRGSPKAWRCDDCKLLSEDYWKTEFLTVVEENKVLRARIAKLEEAQAEHKRLWKEQASDLLLLLKGWIQKGDDPELDGAMETMEAAISALDGEKNG